ncbi:ribonuclease III [Candidatus Endolissoclinum faulkneri L2]|uniref:Ribonuclease 3 n=1 Tax=Candidatus Endolissoclinum faulkneri L2 TaxID=1193729 RepID=K7YSS3_9PROT|nr:ribonuclease III [Candidatus Endolissoclinum faulkneri]AFX99614.1 ribonuclease III [Candidatus Endolissoclinum faulkneri L2]
MKSNSINLSVLSNILYHKFKNIEVLRQAITHASASPWAWNAYERLEFLGDRVLALIVTEQLLERFPNEREGAIAKRHVNLVRCEALAKVARTIQLGKFLILSRGEDNAGSRNSDAILSDAMEAVIGALYFDGGIEAARRFVTVEWNKLLELDILPPQDPKTSLQEWAQGHKLAMPRYTTTTQSGPAHSPQFTVQVIVDGYKPSIGVGRSKRLAEQAAAAKLIKLVSP